jgi:hypothetical protein
MMQSVAQRVGIFVKQRKKTKGFKTRFFVIDNECNLLYTPNLAYIERLMRTSETISDIIKQCSTLKKLSFKNAKIGPPRLFYTIDSIPLANKNCFEMFIEVPAQGLVSLILFSYQDDLITYLHDFFKNYSTYVTKFNVNTLNPIKKALAANPDSEEEKFSGGKASEEEHSRDEAEIRSKFELIAKAARGEGQLMQN